MKVGVVTDSTTDLPLDLAEELGIRIVPMSVAFADRSYISRLEISDVDFYRRLAEDEHLPTTSQPPPVWFEEAYADCADDGLDAVVSIHVSKELSGTVSTATLAAAEAPLPVDVVDSRQVGGGLALMVLAAQRAAAAGAGADEVRETAEQVGRATVNTVVVDTFDYLKRGGRVTGTQAFVGGMLRVKPLLRVADGRIEPLDRARTMQRGMQSVLDHTLEAVGDGPLDVVITHALAPERAGELELALRQRVEVAHCWTLVFGPVLGTHTGPGAVALAATPSTTSGLSTASED